MSSHPRTSAYEISHTWFQGSELRKTIFNFLDPTERRDVLEIGSYEGGSTCFFIDQLLEHPQSRLVCVDPFLQDDPTTPLTNETERRFVRNILRSKYPHKVTIHRTTSDDYFHQHVDTFDFVYVDGSHIPSQIAKDFENAYRQTKSGGIIWLDDYLGTPSPQISDAIDRIITSKGASLQVIHKGYQIAVRKVM